MKLTDEMLERALRDAEDGALTELPPNAGEEHVFSSRFERKMRRALREQNRTPSQKKKTAYCRRAAACAAAVLVVASTAVMSVGALRNKFFHRVAKDFGEYTSIEYQTSGGQGADEALREYGELAEKYVVYRPQYVPDGFVLEEVPDLQGGIRVCDYKNGEGEWISFTQCEIGSTTTCVDTEDAYQEEIELNGEKAMYILKNDLQTLIWDDDRYSFLLHVPLTDGIDQEEAVKIAESLAPVE